MRLLRKSQILSYFRSKDSFTTRLKLNNKTIDRLNSIKLLGLWITEDLTWNLNTQIMCKKAYMRMSMLGKLKYVGIPKDDLILIYKLFIRSILEYCSVVFHSSLTEQQTNMIERCQKISLKLILSPNYTDYSSALRTCSLTSLKIRRETRISDFARKALKHPKHRSMFPLSDDFIANPHNIRHKEKYKVNFARTSAYQKSLIPYAQRRLNEEYRNKYKV